MKEEIKKLRERALKSLELAKDAFSKEFYEWCIFHVDQFFQLSLKFFLTMGYFPTINGLENLFDEAGNVDKKLQQEFSLAPEKPLRDLSISFPSPRIWMQRSQAFSFYLRKPCMVIIGHDKGFTKKF